MTTPHRPWSPHPPAHYQEPSTDPRGVENYLASQAQAQPQQYYDPYAQSGTWQPAPPHPPYPAGRQASLPLNSYAGGQQPSQPPNSYGYGYGNSHHQQPTDTSVEALDLAEYSSRLNAHQPYTQSQPQLYIPQPPPQPGYYTHSASYPAAETSHPTVAQPQQPVRDFIDVGPFSYSGIRETSPPPVRPPPAQPRPQRQQTREQGQPLSPVRSPPPRGHLPWASENDNGHDLGDPDPVFPPSSPHRNDSNSFPFNVQAQSAPSAGHTATSETLATSPVNENGPGYKAYSASDPEVHEEKKDWGVRDGDRPGDIGADGKLISNGPRKRMALRVLEVLTGVGACVACIYAFAVPKPNPAAPPASKPAVYVIVVLGFATIFTFAYIYIIRGCFGVGRKHKDDAYSHAMVLPISRHRAGGRKNKKNSKNQDGVQVNLIVDPSYFSPNRENNLTPGVPWSEQQAADSGGVFTSYERERARLSARKGLWWALGLDVLGALVWGTAFILAMIGPRCPVGGYSGWCDAFNGAVACACIGCALFVVSGVLVGRDLMVSRRSERKLGGR